MKDSHLDSNINENDGSANMKSINTNTFKSSPPIIQNNILPENLVDSNRQQNCNVDNKSSTSERTLKDKLELSVTVKASPSITEKASPRESIHKKEDPEESKELNPEEKRKSNPSNNINNRPSHSYKDDNKYNHHNDHEHKSHRHSSSKYHKHSHRNDYKDEHRHSHRKNSYDSERSYSKHHKHHSRDKSRHEHGRHHSKHHHHHHYDDSRSRSRSRSHEKKKEKTAEDYYEERRRARERSRSNSALRVMKMKNLENACGFYQRTYQRPHDGNDPNKSLYWDGYQWVIRPINGKIAQEPIKPDRKIQIANVPLHLNLDANLFKEFILQKMLEKNVISSSETKNLQGTIKTLEFNQENNTAILAMESVELARHMLLIDGIILLGHTLRVSPYKGNNGEFSLDNINKEAAYANSAQLSAKSAAISYAAFQNIINKKDNINFNFSVGENKVVIPNSKIVKIMNAADPECLDNSTLEEVRNDMIEELQKNGKIISSLVIKKGKEKLGAEVGSVFIEFENIKDAEVSLQKIKGRLYDGREIKIVFFDENAFFSEICPSKK